MGHLAGARWRLAGGHRRLDCTKADLVAFTAVVAGFFTLAGALLILRPRQLRGIERRYLTWVGSQSPSLSEPLSPNLWDSLVGLVFLVPWEPVAQSPTGT